MVTAKHKISSLLVSYFAVHFIRTKFFFATFFPVAGRKKHKTKFYFLTSIYRGNIRSLCVPVCVCFSEVLRSL